MNIKAVTEQVANIRNAMMLNIGGRVHLGKAAWVGIGATINNDIEICNGCMIGAGAVVVDNLTEAGTYIGVPAKRRI